MKKILLILLAALLLTGCGAQTQLQTLAEGEIAVYYENATSTKLVPVSYTPQQTEQEKLIRELFTCLQTSGQEDAIASVPSGLTLEGVKFTGNLATLNLTGPYYELEADVQILCLAALTKTMTQVEGVDLISLTLNEEPLTDGSGNPVGVLRPARFIENNVDNPEEYKEISLVLYFANETMDRLVRTTRPISYKADASLERIVVEQLLRGPEEKEGYQTLPSSTNLLGVNVRDGICYVNFDERLITDVLGGYDYIPVYSLVNSLTELPTVNKVQISINGTADAAFQRDITSLAHPFERNLEHVEGD